MIEIATFFCAIIADEQDEPALDLGKIESVFFPKDKVDKEEDQIEADLAQAEITPVNGNYQDRICVIEQKLNDIYIETVHCCPTALTTSSRPQICGNGLFIYADALYWRIYEGGTDYAVTNVSQFGTEFSLAAAEPSSPRRTNFHWAWGYRAGAAYYLPHDQWDLNFKWTRFRDRASDQFQEGVFQFLGNLYGPVVPNIFANKCSLIWKVKYTTADLEIGRGFFLQDNFTVHPFGGIKAAWINQKGNLLFIQNSPLIPPNLAVTSPMEVTNNFSGVGPEVGLDLQLFFNSHWSFFSQFSAALLYGKFDVDFLMHVSNSSFSLTLFDLEADTHRIVPAATNCLGVGWETDFEENKLYLSIHVGYELQVWWRQNQLPNFDTFQKWLRFAENLTIHGLTVDARIDF